MAKFLLGLLLLVLGGLVGSYATSRWPESMEQWLVVLGKDGASAEPEPLYWVAPMDPNYRRDKPGLSPMGMELVPVYAEDDKDQGPGVVSIDPQIVNNLGVRTGDVEFGVLAQQVHSVGFVSYDEDQLRHVHTRLAGWIQKLYHNSDGSFVQQGEPLYELYAPELVTAQQEYLVALRSGSRPLIRASRDKLRALAVSDQAIKAIAKRGKASETITQYAPRCGYISKLSVRQGMYIKPSQTLMAIGPLDQVWVIAEVLERQSPWLQQGAAAELELDYLPGQIWRGSIDYIYPTVDAMTRARKVRLRFDNPEGVLQPGMFGRVSLTGRNTRAQLHIPASALIRTASGQRVVVALGEGQYKSVAVHTGIQAGQRIALLEGLELGDKVVTSAQFLFDSESAISSDLQRISNPESPWPTAWTDARIVAVDREQHSLTLRHQRIDRWRRPAMQMQLPVDQALDIDGLQAGQQLKVQLSNKDGEVKVLQLAIQEQRSAEVSP